MLQDRANILWNSLCDSQLTDRVQIHSEHQRLVTGGNPTYRPPPKCCRIEQSSCGTVCAILSLPTGSRLTLSFVDWLLVKIQLTDHHQTITASIKHPVEQFARFSAYRPGPGSLRAAEISYWWKSCLPTATKVLQDRAVILWNSLRVSQLTDRIQTHSELCRLAAGENSAYRPPPKYYNIEQTSRGTVYEILS